MTDTSTAVLVLRVALALACVLGIIWFAGRRMAGSATARRQRGAAMTVVARQSLGGRNGLAVVDVAGRRLLLGTGEKGVSLLTELEAAPEEDTAVREERLPLTAADLAEVCVDGIEIPADASALTDPSRTGAQDGATGQDGVATPNSRAARARTTFSSTPAARMPAVTEPRNPLEGSILDAATWRRAVVAVQERTVRR